MEHVQRNLLMIAQQADLIRPVLEVCAARGVRGVAVSEPEQAAQHLEDGQWDLVLIDADAPVRGDELLSRSKIAFPERPVVMLGSQAVQDAVRAIRQGADDFLVKPPARQAVEALLESMLPSHAVPPAAASEQDTRCPHQIAGRNERFLRTLELAQRVAPTSAPVLITGESGTGKELVAHLLHRQSSRRRGPFIRVNCASLSDSLLESELFGHERGAFTGAHAQRKGRFERAHGGTILLDEISETGPRLQAELLRVLEQQEFERVGGGETIRVNVRVISTSNRNLQEDVEQGRFRRDLYYRISGVHLELPPLRERRDDIAVLVWHFINEFAGEVRRPIRQVDPQALELLSRHPWPGNVRQLRNVVRSALILADGPVLTLAGVPALREELERASSLAAPSTLRLHELERQAILEALRRTKRNQVKAAGLLGITDRTLREKLRRYREDGVVQTLGDNRW